MNRLTLMLTNLARKPTRTTLTFLSLVIAFLLFMLLRSIAAAFASGVAVEGPQRLYIDSKYSMVDNLPMSHIHAIGDVDGVADVTQVIWFGGYYQDQSNNFPKLVVDHERYLDVFPEVTVDDEVLNRFNQSRRGVLVAETIAAQFGWQVGDLIPIRGDIWPKEDGSWHWEFEFAGTYGSTADSRIQPVMIIRHDYFNESAAFWIKDQVGWAIARLEEGIEPKTVIDAIDRLFENSPDPTRSLSEDEYSRQFANQLGDMGVITTLILTAVFFTILLLTANVALLSFRERIPELAVMKTLGFQNQTISLLVLGEAMLLSLAGGLGGIALGFAVEPGLSAGLTGVFGQFQMSWVHAGQALLIALGMGFVIGLPPAFAASNLPIVDALRERD